MKIYPKISTPREPKRDRNFFQRVLPSRILDFFTGCKNLIKWTPTIYNDRDWDTWHILNIIQKKIEFQRREIVKSDWYTCSPFKNRDMTIVLNLIEREKEDFYSTEYIEYYDSNFEFVPTESSPETYELKEDLISERYDEFLNKYPSTLRKVFKELNPDKSEKKLLCHYVAKYNQKKAHDLLYRILSEKIDGWWD
jgi:hypothetical protein